MKKIIFIISIIALLTGCTKDFLNINVDPNNPKEALLNQVLPSIESGIGYGLAFEGNGTGGLQPLPEFYMHQIGMYATEDQYAVTGNSYYIYTPWDVIYTEPVRDLEYFIPKAVSSGNLVYAGIGKTLKAFLFSQLVDVFGDIPYSEAGKLTEGIVHPKFDDDAEIYPKLIALLDSAISDFSNETAKNALLPGNDDLIYGGVVENWVRAAKTIKLKLLLQTRLVDNVSAKINALITEDMLIQEGADFQMPFGSSNNPDDRNPGFHDYEAGQRLYFISPWFYEILSGYNPNIFNGIADPRIPYYFYNQLAPGEDDRDGNKIEYRDGGFVSIYFGSIGPDHAHAQDRSMTVLGMYPVGGRYDEGDAQTVNGTLGTGTAPIRFITYADVLYFKAELALVGITADNATTLLSDAMYASFRKVDEVVAGTKTAQAVPVLSGSGNDTAYVTAVMGEYTAGSSAKKLEIVMTQKWIEDFGNGIESYNSYRRTGYPVIFDPKNTTMAPGGKVTPPEGDPVSVACINPFPLSFAWSRDEINMNKNAPKQKNPGTYPVFWDK